MTDFTPRVGQWLWSTCSASYFGEIVGVGKCANGEPTIDIRLEEPDLILSFPGRDGEDGEVPPLTSIELPHGVKLILRGVEWDVHGGIVAGHQTIDCVAPGDGCRSCTSHFWIHEEKRP